MGKPRCKGTDCTKFAHQKKLVNEHQKGLGIDLLTLCNTCAKDRYRDYVGLVCSFADCTTAPRGGAFGMFCKSHSPLKCSVVDCTTSPQGGKHGSFCLSHTNYITPITLVKETAESVEELTSVAISKIDKGKQVYAGLMGTTGLGAMRARSRSISVLTMRGSSMSSLGRKTSPMMTTSRPSSEL